MKLLKRHWMIAALVVVAIAVFAAFQFKGNDKPQYFTAKADRGDIREVVEATGTINAVITVQVGSQVSGTIAHLYADFNSLVKKGQVVAQIDPSLFRGTLLQAKADLANAKANLIASQERLERIEQAVDSIAIEVERVSENQRFMTRLMTETQLGDTIKDVRKSAELAKSAAESP